MGKQQNIVPLKELNLTNRFLFDEVMDRATYQDVLEIIFGKEISLLDQPLDRKGASCITSDTLSAHGFVRYG